MFPTCVSAVPGPLHFFMNLRTCVLVSSRNQLGFEVMVTLLGRLERTGSALVTDCSVGADISQQ